MRFSFKDIIKTIIISLGWLIAISIMGIIILFLFGNPDNPDTILYSVGIIFIPFFIMTMLTINKYLLRKNGLGWDSLGFIPLKKKQLLKLAWQVPLCWFFIFLVELVFLVVFFGDSSNLPDTQSSAQIMELTPFIFVLVFLAYAILTPILEEIIFRGGLLQALENKFNAPVAMIGSSFLFTLAHGIPLIIPALFMMGLSFAYLYQKYRSIYAPIILHMFTNGVNVIAVNIVL
ncbi:CPBP family intramembrane glutamic endopeptidase [Lentibacillus sp. Marseille-P4043]|uniref:CPBP family intramembrane glutamic endopeptidase n=1 Tax=Lentibacillus sp. Marseille-P4043 TaxID=2040293 RepID=UPI000D0AD92B|nr:CPBP family intramembrane glutamic endopeptidase [Lentibacillus sp. Marseille-P4043]